MAFSIEFPRNSFISNVSNCICLPIVEGDELAFQFIIKSENKSDIDELLEHEELHINLYFYNDNGDSTVSCEIQLLRLDDFNILYAVKSEELSLGFDIGEKFFLSIEIPEAEQFYSTSNCFEAEDDKEFSSLIKYRNNEDAFGFTYCPFSEFYNIIRLPIYLNNMQLPDEEEVYRQSDGHVRVLKSVTSKQFDLITDHLSPHYHTCLKLALSSDMFFIDCDFHHGEIRKNGGYSIEWVENVNHKIGKATTQVFALPFDEKNTLCEQCNECDDLFKVYGFYPEQKNNCDGTFSVRAFAQTSQPATLKFETIYVGGSTPFVVDVQEFTASSEKRDYSYELNVYDNHYDLKITASRGDCIETITLPFSTCDCPTEEEIMELLDVSFTYYPPDPPRPAYVESVSIDFTQIKTVFPNVQEVNLYHYVGDTEEPTYEVRDEVDYDSIQTFSFPDQDMSTFVYIEFICCLDGGDICETRVKYPLS